MKRLLKKNYYNMLWRNVYTNISQVRNWIIFTLLSSVNDKVRLDQRFGPASLINFLLNVFIELQEILRSNLTEWV